MRRGAIVVAGIAMLLAETSCSPGGPAGLPVRKEPPFVQYHAQQMRRDLTGKTRPDVERILGEPDSVSGFSDPSTGTSFYKTYERKRHWAVIDPRTENPCPIIIFRFEKGVVQDVEFRCW